MPASAISPNRARFGGILPVLSVEQRDREANSPEGDGPPARNFRLRRRLNAFIFDVYHFFFKFGVAECSIGCTGG
jgi:hypothetical protein